MTTHKEFLLSLEDKGKELFMAYVKTTRIKDPTEFYSAFGRYFEQLPLGADGYKTVSKYSFKNFLVLEILSK